MEQIELWGRTLEEVKRKAQEAGFEIKKLTKTDIHIENKTGINISYEGGEVESFKGPRLYLSKYMEFDNYLSASKYGQDFHAAKEIFHAIYVDVNSQCLIAGRGETL